MRDPTVSPEFATIYSASFVTNAMPVRRSPSQNLTGLYLGIEGGRDPPRPRQSIPPLARGRGKPSHRPKTPVEQRRYRTVERNRVKDENFQVRQGLKGFSGNVLKSRPRGVKAAREPSPEPELPAQFPVTFTDIIRQTDRHFTAMTNDGVTRFEKLNRAFSPVSCPDCCPRAFTQTPADILAHEVERGTRSNCEMLGLTECYKKICKGSVESLYSLLPPKKTLERLRKTDRPNKYTGFSVKSYRNPNSADIIACFPEHRAKTVLGVFTSGSRVHYTPHYFKYFSPMYTPMPTSNSSSVDVEAVRPLGATAILQQMPIKGAPVARRLQNTPCANTSSLLDNSVWPSSGLQELAPVTSDIEEPLGVNEGCALLLTSETASADIQQLQSPGGATKEQTPPEVSTNAAKTGTESETEMAATGERPRRLVKTPSGAEIKIDLEDECGEKLQVEIDVADPAAEPDANESPAPEAKRRVSISERVLKMRNSEEQLQCLNDDAAVRKKELASLLDEHAHLVEQVSTMEVHRCDPASPGSDKENKTFNNDGALAKEQ